MAMAITPPTFGGLEARIHSARRTVGHYIRLRRISTRGCPTIRTRTSVKPDRHSDWWVIGSLSGTVLSSGSRSTYGSVQCKMTSARHRTGIRRDRSDPFLRFRTGNCFNPAERFESPWGELPRETYDLPLPDSGSWWVCGPFWNRGDRAMEADLAAETDFDPEATFDGMHDEESLG